MKKFKFLGLSFFIIILTYFLYLYHSNRIFILWQKNDPIHQVAASFYIEEYNGIWIDFINGQTKKIPCRIDSLISVDTVTKEDLLYLVLHKFFYYINIEHINWFQYFLKHVVLYDKVAIINGYFIFNKKLTPQQEYFFLKSIYITVINIFPEIQEIYFYNDSQEENNFQFVAPFFEQKMLSKDEHLYLESISGEDKSDYSFYLIPFIFGIGTKLYNIYEKNIYELSKSPFLLHQKFSHQNHIINFVNKYKIDDWNKVILYINFVPSNKDSITFYYYPFFDSHDHIFLIPEFPKIIKNNYLFQNIILNISQKISNSQFCIAPFIFLKNTVYPSFYVLCTVTNQEKVKEYMRLLENICLKN